MDEEQIKSIVERIRKMPGKPSSIVAELRTGERRPLTLANGRARWVALERVLGSLDWRTIELFAADGGLLDIVRSDAEGDAEAIEVAPAPVPMPQSREGEIGTIIVSACTQILDRWVLSFGPALQALAEVQTLTAARLAQLEQDRAEAVAEQARAKLPADPDDPDAANGNDKLVAELIRAAGPELVKRFLGSPDKALPADAGPGVVS